MAAKAENKKYENNGEMAKKYRRGNNVSSTAA